MISIDFHMGKRRGRANTKQSRLCARKYHGQFQRRWCGSWLLKPFAIVFLHIFHITQFHNRILSQCLRVLQGMFGSNKTSVGSILDLWPATSVQGRLESPSKGGEWNASIVVWMCQWTITVPSKKKNRRILLVTSWFSERTHFWSWNLKPYSPVCHFWRQKMFFFFLCVQLPAHPTRSKLGLRRGCPQARLIGIRVVKPIEPSVALSDKPLCTIEMSWNMLYGYTT